MQSTNKNSLIVNTMCGLFLCLDCKSSKLLAIGTGRVFFSLVCSGSGKYKHSKKKPTFLKSGKVGSCILSHLFAINRLSRFLIRFLIPMKEIQFFTTISLHISVFIQCFCLQLQLFLSYLISRLVPRPEFTTPSPLRPRAVKSVRTRQ